MSEGNKAANYCDFQLILPFVRENRRDRWKELSLKPKGRKKLLTTLWNGDDFDRSLMTKIDPAERTASTVLVKLRKLGAPIRCHLISARPTLDAKDLDLISALDLVFNSAPGTIISCVPGTLAYYENDERNGNFIIYLPHHQDGWPAILSR